jgi:nitrite reductase/ring-hydroxylating ferredoxin subunit
MAGLVPAICSRPLADPRVKPEDDEGGRGLSEPPGEFAAVAQISDIPAGGMKCVAVDRNRVLLAHIDGQFYAISDVCGHRNAPLSRGRLDGHIVECPLHFAQFDVRTGKLVDGPVSADVACYETRVEGDTVFIKR